MKTSVNVHPQIQGRDSTPAPSVEARRSCVYSSGLEVQLEENMSSFRPRHRNDSRSLSGGITSLDLIINTNAVQKGCIIYADDEIAFAKPCETVQRDPVSRITSAFHLIALPKPRGEKFLEQKRPSAAITPFP